MPRPYRLGKRQPAVDRTGARILDAARNLVAESGDRFSIGTLADRAGVSRATVYNRHGSRGALLDALRPRQALDAPDLRTFIERACAAWAANPRLYRHLGPAADLGGDAPRRLAESLAAADALRPGCSLKEAEDVIAVVTSFGVFDRLHHDGRRSTASVADILHRLAGAILVERD
jgi:AcrR family transcriptional regulator